MRKSQALIDNDALVNLTQLAELGIFDLIRNLFFRINLPIEIKNEYETQVGREPHRNLILKNLLPNRGFWSLCTKFDSFSSVLLFNFRGIDKGEAELISQGEKIGVRIVISDDLKFKKAIEELNKNFHIVTSLYIIASLDINGFISDNRPFLKLLYESRPFSAAQLRNDYKIALKEYGIFWTKKKLSEKIGLKKILES